MLITENPQFFFTKLFDIIEEQSLIQYKYLILENKIWKTISKKTILSAYVKSANTQCFISKVRPWNRTLDSKKTSRAGVLKKDLDDRCNLL